MEDKAEIILEVLKKAQLQKICEENGLPTFGRNEVLRARMTEWAATTGNSLQVSVNIQNSTMEANLLYWEIERF